MGDIDGTIIQRLDERWSTLDGFSTTQEFSTTDGSVLRGCPAPLFIIGVYK